MLCLSGFKLYSRWVPLLRVRRDDRHVFLKNEYSTTPGTITKIWNDLKWPILGKFLKVYHLHVVLIAIRYAKKGTNM